MRNNKYDLNRFVEAQNGVYPIALKELQEGRKRSHWMWYIFPQLKYLGHSYNAKYYGISGIAEATAYLQHPILGQRLREVTSAILHLSGNDAESIFGCIDAMKLRSSMTLFEVVSPQDVFSRVLDKYFGGLRDFKSIKLIEETNEIN